MRAVDYKYWEHQFPKILLKRPLLIRWMYLFNKFIHVRNWYVLKVLHGELKKQNPQNSFVDLGCGEGQYSLPLKASYPNLHFKLIDKVIENIEFANLYIAKASLTNISTSCQMVENYNLPNCNLSLCVGVFQYIKDHEKAIQNIFNNTSFGGKLIIYFSINGRFVFKTYKRFLLQYPNYETLNNRQRIYTYNGAVKLLEEAGFKIQKQKFTYGFFGIISNELYNMQIIYLAKSPTWVHPFLYLLIFFSLTPIFICNVIDYLLPKTNGNGLLIVAEKQ